jgi:periplasmic protein TonB
MTLTIKNPPELNSPGKPGAPSQNSENKTGQSPRSDPVCLEVNITIRSLPTETGGLTQPIREEGRTVIVFDNGAVLRTTNNMPIGQTVIVSNPSGRDVVCRVVGGRNLPNVKGYVEVEFLEPVNDFWGIHRDVDPVAVAAPPVAPVVPREAPIQATPAPPVPPRVAAPLETSAKPAIASLGSNPTFENIGGPVSMPPTAVARGSKTEPGRPGPQMMTKDASDYNLSEIAEPTSIANWGSSPSELPKENQAIAAKRESSSIPSPAPVPSRDFMSKGLMAYDQPGPSSSASSGRVPLTVGVAALVLAGVCAVVFFMYRRTAPVSVAKAAVVSQPSTPEPPAAISAPEPVQAPPAEAAPAATQTQIQAQPVAVEQAQPVAAIAPIPAVVTSPATTDSRTDSRNVRRQEKSAVVTKQPDLSSSRRPAIPNLKMNSPSAPNQNLAKLGEGTAPITEIASTEAVGGSTPAGLLTSAGRTSNPPAPPPFAPAPVAPAPVTAAKTVRDPKLISSTRLVYPPTAKQSNIQGTVTVSANIDANGKVVSAKALSGPLLLREAAVESVKQWKYSPGLIDGKPAPSQVTVNVEFRLN